MQRRRRVCRPSVLGAVATVLVLFACACGRATPTPPAATIRFACADEDLGYYDQLAHTFAEQHPGVTVTVVPKRPAALTAIDPRECDAFIVSDSSAPRLAQGGVASLESWLGEHTAAVKAEFYSAALSAFVRSGKTWAVPTGVDPVVMFYNKTLFDARGVPYPAPGWTWDDFLQSARRLRSAGAGVYGYAAGVWPDEALLFVLQHGGNIVDDWQNPTRATFDDPATVEAMEWYAELMYRHDVSPNPDEARAFFGGGRQAAYNGVLQGKVGMWMGPYSSRTALDAHEPKIDYGVVPLPADRQAVTLAQVEGVAVSAEARNAAICWEWALFLSRQVPRRLAPARRALLESEQYAAKVGAEAAGAAREAMSHALVLPAQPSELYSQAKSLWSRAVSNVASGRYGAYGALQEAQRQLGR